MRKVILLGLLATSLVMALVLDKMYTEVPDRLPDQRLVLRLGGVEPDPDRPLPPRSTRPKAGTNKSSPDQQAIPVTPPRAEKRPQEADSAARIHVVKAGETLWGIARDHLGAESRWRDLARWNQMEDPAALRAGQKIRLDDPANRAAPTPSTPPAANGFRLHVVGKGDTLTGIASAYLGSASRWVEIQECNEIKDPKRILPGVQLKIPER